ncbi:hypothetical protein NIES806_20060 [Dolichospermum compactum NIES-806]|uniref:Uncharacterized protein n=2 Tax=Dolichospermum compactum TaxID=136073 RepID=A0A1Z4V2Q4_9CYAN|nr:hypothetical protein NIES806_20060 [Dolichospermum compactum NIES-806]
MGNTAPRGRAYTPKNNLQVLLTICYIYLHKVTKSQKRGSQMAVLISLLVVGWVAVAVIGSLAYFLGEQSKPIHERNWASDKFAALAKSITGVEIDYTQRTPAYAIDAYNSRNLPQ